MNRSKISSPLSWKRWRKNGSVCGRYTWKHKCHVIATVTDDDRLLNLSGYSESYRTISVCPRGCVLVPVYETTATTYNAASNKARYEAPFWVYPWLARGRKWYNWRCQYLSKNELQRVPDFIAARAEKIRDDMRKWRSQLEATSL